MFKVSPGEVGNKDYSGFNRSDWKRGEDQHKAAIKMALLLIKISLTSEIKKIIINIDHSKTIYNKEIITGHPIATTDHCLSITFPTRFAISQF